MRSLAPVIKITKLLFCFAAVAFILVYAVAACGTAHAEGGLAISGGFPEQLVIPQGGSASGPSINLVVFNNKDTDISFSMKTDAPPGVNIILSQEEFTLSPGSNKEILVRIEVESYADPGTHQITITAEAYSQGVSGIQLVGAPGRSASLTILGESAQVTVNAVSPEGTPVIAVVRLYRVINNWNYEIGYSNTGSLQATVAPGSFVAEAYVGGQKLDEKSFDVADGESKVVNLEAATIYFEQFDVLEYFNSDTGAFAFAQVVYTIRNLYEAKTNAAIVLEVTRDGQSLGDVHISSLGTLDTGRYSSNYNYFPFDGWIAGNYGFTLKLLIEEDLFTYTQVKYINVTGSASPAADNGPNIALIAGIVCTVIILLSIAYFMIYRSRKDAGGDEKRKPSGAAKPKPGGTGRIKFTGITKQKPHGTKKHRKEGK